MRRGCEKKWDGSGGQDDQALGRSRGGFGTKVHGSFDGLGHPVELLLTAAQESDIAQAEVLLADHTPEVVIADKGYDKKALVDAFTRMTVANYAKSFDSHHGETFTVEPASITRGSDRFVKSTMKTSSETIAFNYRTHQVGSEWKITDVYLAGNISQMAQKRSDFASTLQSGGASGLTKRINALTDQMLG